MAIAKPDNVDASFNSRIEIIRNYFDPLNPYLIKQPLFKLEDENYRFKGRQINSKNSAALFPGNFRQAIRAF